MLKPSELKKKSFSKTMRGYSIPEVDEYMDFLIEKYTELFRKNFELEQQLRATVEQKSELEGEKESVRNALINAQKVASKIVEGANERADEIVNSAKHACNTILTELSEQISSERDTIVELKKQSAKLKSDLYETYRAHIEQMEKITSVTESVKVKTSEEYLKDAVKKTEAALKRSRAEEKATVNVNFDFADTAETPSVKASNGEAVDPDELFEGSDTVVFDKIEADKKDEQLDNSATRVLDKVSADE